MRKVVYSVATSLDGYVAGPNGEADWITMDPEIDFAAIFARFDVVLMGRKTYDQVRAMGGGAGDAGGDEHRRLPHPEAGGLPRGDGRSAKGWRNASANSGRGTARTSGSSGAASCSGRCSTPGSSTRSAWR